MRHPAYYVRFYGLLFAKHLRLQADNNRWSSEVGKEALHGIAGAIEGVFLEMEDNARKKLKL